MPALAAHRDAQEGGINSLGMGGTNAHIVLEEAPAREPSGPSRPWQLLLFSARTATALAQVQHGMGDFLRQHQETNLADVAYTLQAGRRRFEQRSMLLCHDREEAIRLLKRVNYYQDERNSVLIAQ